MLDLISFLGEKPPMPHAVTMILTLRTDELDRDHPVRRWLVELDRMADGHAGQPAAAEP